MPPPDNGIFLSVRVHLHVDLFRTRNFVSGPSYLLGISILKKLWDSQERFLVHFENAPIAYHAVDQGGRLVEVNQAWLDMLEYAKEEVIGKKILDFEPMEMRYVVDQYCSSDDQVDESRGFDFPLCKKDGEAIIIECRVKADQRKPAKPSMVHWVLWDITRQREAEKEREQIELELRQAQKMQSVGVLAGGIAHEFNNIMTIIVGNNELAMDDYAKGRNVKEYLEEIHIASIRARDIVRQLLTFGRKSSHPTVPVDIVPIVQESLKLIRSTLPANIEMQWTMPEAVFSVDADPTQIQQVIINICKNAADAMPDEKGLITVQLGQLDVTADEAQKHNGLNSGMHAELVIGDNGRGIDSSIIDRIFDPFFSTKDVGMGTGMGLSVAHGIVQRHGGQIRVKSDTGKGTTFTVLFPLQQGWVKKQGQTSTPLPTGSEHLLFVDDEAATTKFIQKLLERMGYRVTTSTSHRRALDMFCEAPDDFDLVITDMAMPRMTGDVLAAEMLKIRPNLPVILCTGYSEKISEEKAHSMGIRHFAVKPLEKARMAGMIRQVLDTENAA